MERLAFWEKCAERLDWIKRWDQVLDWQAPFAKWFLGGKLNACYNCVDRHVTAGHGDVLALIWEGEGGEERRLTYRDLLQEVSLFANVLKSFGVVKGDRVAIYLPMIPEAVIALLACARIGAIHTVVFGGFAADALRGRLQDASAKVLITADGGFRRGKMLPLKATADSALEEAPSVEKVLVVRRTGEQVQMREGRDHWLHEERIKATEECPCEPMEANETLFILYTSGTTGKPKGIMHGTGGYLVGVHATTEWVFGLQSSDVYWCSADVGWITGHSYVTYGPLSHGKTQLIYEGAPDWPARDRFWRLIEKYGVTVLYTTPTLIRTFMKWGESILEGCNLSSLRLLGSVGEPINPEAWLWYSKHVGAGRCPIVDTWWQTETGAIMIAPLPGVTALKPGSATFPLPGIEASVWNTEGEEVSFGEGYLVLTEPWPSMMQGIYLDPKRYQEVYWSRFTGVYFSGDGARRDEEGYYWLLGRVDDVMNVAGHRMSSMELESAFIEHPAVAEAAVVGAADPIKGQAIVAFLTLKEGVLPSEALQEELSAHLVAKIGAIARPKKILFAKELPKTRSGKIMRRLLRNLAEGKELGDLTTLADLEAVKLLGESLGS